MYFKFPIQRILASISASLVLVCLFSHEALCKGRSESGDAPAAGRSQSDDDLVRRAYINLQLYHSAGKRAEAAENKREHIPYDDIDIYVYNIYTGSISEIRDRKYFDLVTAPADEVIELASLVRTSDKDPTEYLVYEAKWARGHYFPPNTISLGQTLQIAGPKYADVEKFSSYEVRVRLDGKEKTYKALALYHTPAQTRSTDSIEYIDMILGNGGALTRLATEKRPAYDARRRIPSGKGSGVPTRPKPLLKEESELLEQVRGEENTGSGSINPAIQFDRQGFEGTSNLLYAGGSCDYSGICCPFDAWSLADCCIDPWYSWGSNYLPTCSTGGGGGGGGGYDSGYGGGGSGSSTTTSGGTCLEEIYYANPVNHQDGNDSGHLFGGHGGNSSIQSYCQIDSACNATCKADFLDIQTYENGMRKIDVIPTLGSLLWHSIGSVDKRVETATGYVNGNNTPPTCAAALGFNVQSCIMGFVCNYAVTISGNNFGLNVSSNGDALFTYSHTSTHTCPRIN